MMMVMMDDADNDNDGDGGSDGNDVLSLGIWMS